MPVFYKVKKNNNSKSRAYNKFYGRIKATVTMTYRQLVKHISEHDTVYGEDLCLGVANKLQKCILEQLAEGKKVQFGDLGTFYLSMKSSGAESADKYSVNENVNGVYLRFLPSQADINTLTSKALKKKVNLVNVDTWDAETDEGDGDKPTGGA